MNYLQLYFFLRSRTTNWFLNSMLNWHSFQESDKNIAWWCWMDSYSLWLDLYICLTQRLVCDLLPIFPRDVLASSSADLHYLYMIFFFRLMIVSPKFIILVFTWNEMEDSSCIIYWQQIKHLSILSCFARDPAWSNVLG